MSAYDALETLGITLPVPTAPVASFAPYVRAGDLLFVSGHIARRHGTPWAGRLGAGLTTEDGREAARLAAIDLLGTLHAATGDLDAIVRVVKLMVLVNSAPTFTEQHLVANGASELLQRVLGAAGAHARNAFGVAQIPFGACVEIEAIVQMR